MSRQAHDLRSYTVSKDQMKQRERYLNHQLIQAIEFLKLGHTHNGEAMYGLIGWEGTMMVDDYYEKFFEMDAKEVEEIEEQPCYVFRYDGEVLSILL